VQTGTSDTFGLQCSWLHPLPCLCCLYCLQLPSILEFNISAPPLPNENDSLVFVCLRLCTYPKKQKCSLPKFMAAKFMEVFATSAQQFKGYMFQVSEKAFQEVGPAVALGIVKLQKLSVVDLVWSLPHHALQIMQTASTSVRNGVLQRISVGASMDVFKLTSATVGMLLHHRASGPWPSRTAWTHCASATQHRCCSCTCTGPPAPGSTAAQRSPALTAAGCSWGLGCAWPSTSQQTSL
jgi:hypothetical protein